MSENIRLVSDICLKMQNLEWKQHILKTFMGVGTGGVEGAAAPPTFGTGEQAIALAPPKFRAFCTAML